MVVLELQRTYVFLLYVSILSYADSHPLSFTTKNWSLMAQLLSNDEERYINLMAFGPRRASHLSSAIPLAKRWRFTPARVDRQKEDQDPNTMLKKPGRL